jgi:hypothetical protein
MPAPFGGNVSPVGGDVTLGGGVQNHLGGPNALGKGSLTSRHVALASFEIGLPRFPLSSHNRDSTTSACRDPGFVLPVDHIRPPPSCRSWLELAC